ncbi:hypothetical protein ILUMI_20775 [Ignelater luminosus]|uniref:Uncharacterized protein n=1 Tax=Ignelater luminosus TaxID=2038154 RepID=A0A8K0CHK7_IGNLU|nr:hypothetical protein ILUMI_20775 [Ignelater luminosus]
MKIVFVVFNLFLIVFIEAKIDFNIYEEDCITQLNVDREQMIEAFNQDFYPEDNQDFTNVLTCSWKKAEIIDKDENLDVDKLRQFLVDNFAKVQGSNYLIATLVAADALHHCEHVKGQSRGDIAVKMSNCILRKLDSYDV